MKKIYFLSMLLSISLIGCGGDDGMLATQSLMATVDTSVMDSDIVVWVDSTGAKTTACSATSLPSIPVADSVNVAIKSTANSNNGSISSPIRIESATITYTPANSSTPAMVSEFQTINMIVANGSTATIPVRVSTQEQKSALYSALACNSNIYNYYTTFTFNITEIGSDKKISLSTSMQLRFADFIDK